MLSLTCSMIVEQSSVWNPMDEQNLFFLSMPPMASWVYDYQAREGSAEANTLSLLKKDVDWVNID